MHSKVSADMDSKPCFLVFSDDFGEHPSSCQHIFRYIAEDHPVLWVNTIGMRSMRFTRRDLRKAFAKAMRMLEMPLRFLRSHNASEQKPASRGSSAIDICQPLMLPFPTSRLIRKFNSRSVVRNVRRHLVSRGMSRPILVTTAPNACDYLEGIQNRKIVYYCVDDFSEWPGLHKDLVADMELQLLRRCDSYIATSDALLERGAREGRSGILLTHGVEISHFASPPDHEHQLLSNIPAPRVGYFGLFDDRTDQVLLTDLARKLPGTSFVITGNVETDTADLQRAENIYFTGSVPYSELPAVAKGFDVCVLPYKVNKLTNAIQPLKFKEYMATGKPVISTPIREALALSDLIDVAGTSDEWVRIIQQHLDGTAESKGDKRRTFLQSESWESKARAFLAHCLD